MPSPILFFLLSVFVICLTLVFFPSSLVPVSLWMSIFLLPCLFLHLIQTSRRSSHRCERSPVREQYHAMERCYFWVSHVLIQLHPAVFTVPLWLWCTLFSTFSCSLKVFLIVVQSRKSECSDPAGIWRRKSLMNRLAFVWLNNEWNKRVKTLYSSKYS